MIVVFVSWLLLRCLMLYNEETHAKTDLFSHSTLLEIVWTIVPALILMFIAIPSFALLYALDEYIDPTITLKVIGHQWYWSYEYNDANISSMEGNPFQVVSTIAFDSYMIAEEDLSHAGQLRLLEVDNIVKLPTKTPIRVLVTSADVLHSWAIPSLGVKVDACPGRLNQIVLFIKREGSFFGQCSEICGVNHGFMPIYIKATNLFNFTSWYREALIAE
jgi:cytochrome c oxidase subunit 2